MTSDQDASPLISAGDLSSASGSTDTLVVDCRFDLARPEAGRAAYALGHVPGACYADLNLDLSAPVRPGAGRHPLPAPGALIDLFSGWGIAPGVTVVAYDDSGGAIAARLWWLLRWMGHRSVRLLDGGWQAWCAGGHPVSQQPCAPRRARFEGAPNQMPVADTAEVLRRLRDPNLLLIDARSSDRFKGFSEPIDPVAGHVPGALNAPYQANLTPSGTFKDSVALASAWRPLLEGRRPQDVVVMCGSGVTACHNLLAMEVAGFPGNRLYPGSWSEWITDVRRPVERG